MRRRVFILFFIIACLWILGLANFTIEVFFTETRNNCYLVYTENGEEYTLDFPGVFVKEWYADIIVPPGMEKLPGNRLMFRDARYIFYYSNNYYWVNESFEIIDFAAIDELENNVIYTGLDFFDNNGVYSIRKNMVDEIHYIVSKTSSLSQGSVKISYVDIENKHIVFRRGINVRIFEWETLDLIDNSFYEIIEKSDDRSEFVLFSDGKLLRVR
ncbi:MAG: DUF4894 domain-containing protein [Kosmotoga sp.]|nr:MAG: DUF4894 domain-containing protein [Kosmotoga sp.]